MAKVNFVEFVDSVQGKYCRKRADGPIFAERKDTGTRYVYHIHNPFAGDPTPKQMAYRDVFSDAHTAVATVYADATQLNAAKAAFKKQKKYRSLRGYIFAREYATALAAAQTAGKIPA